jgi:hypothetical protein
MQGDIKRRASELVSDAGTWTPEVAALGRQRSARGHVAIWNEAERKTRRRLRMFRTPLTKHNFVTLYGTSRTRMV